MNLRTADAAPASRSETQRKPDSRAEPLRLNCTPGVARLWTRHLQSSLRWNLPASLEEGTVATSPLQIRKQMRRRAGGSVQCHGHLLGGCDVLGSEDTGTVGLGTLALGHHLRGSAQTADPRPLVPRQPSRPLPQGVWANKGPSSRPLATGSRSVDWSCVPHRLLSSPKTWAESWGHGEGGRTTATWSGENRGGGAAEEQGLKLEDSRLED